MENTVKAFFEWKKNVTKKNSVEMLNSNNSHISNWDNTDVLYSFIMIYQIGIYVFYPELCNRTNYSIKRREGGFFKTDYLLAEEGGKPRYMEYEKLNTAIEKTSFIEKYTLPGNVMPIWPGGNVDKGEKSYCFDIPDLYFYKNRRWAYALQTVYIDSFLDEVIYSSYAMNTKKFLDYMNEDTYMDFLNHICKVIETRNKKMC